MRILIFGPPGAGKGTQSQLLQERRSLTPISTGVLIRSRIKAGTPEGRTYAKYINVGRLVPGLLVRRIAEDAIAELGYDDYILDGYPRTVEQAEWLEAFLAEHQTPLHAVISLQVPTDVIVDRLSKRRVHTETGANYHLDFNPPPSNIDPSLLIQRPDDRPEAIRKRLEVYHERTAPVEAYLAEHETFFEIDGLGEIEEVYNRIEHALSQAEPANKSV